MALPSQSRSSGNATGFSGKTMHRTSPRGKWRIAIAIGAPLLLIGVWWLWPSGGPKDPQAAGESFADTPLVPQEQLGSSADPGSPSAASQSENDSPPPTIAGTTTQQPSPVDPRPLGDLALESPAGNPATQPITPAAASSTAPSPDMSTGAVQRLLMTADAAEEAGRLLDARVALNRALHHPLATEPEREALRARLSQLNETMVFSRAVIPADPLVETYTIQTGDSLSKVVQDHDLDVDWRLVQRINGLTDPRRIRVGQTLKLLRGPFHAIVSKDSHRLDLYANYRDPDGHRLYLKSFRVGLGEYGGTPVGTFIVRRDSKLINPEWVNPRTGERYGADDPENPIGERWIGLEGADERTQQLAGYGIHGTIEPESIGADASMGCVRMLHDDVVLLYEMLVARVSEVEITP